MVGRGNEPLTFFEMLPKSYCRIWIVEEILYIRPKNGHFAKMLQVL